jgi:glycosyltransferase involved in cell wall biosynthesis
VSIREIWIHALGAKIGGGITYLQSALPELFRQLEGRDVRVILLLPAALPAGIDAPGWVEVRTYPHASRQVFRLLFDQLVLPFQLLGGRGRTALYCTGSFSPFWPPVRTVALLRNAIYFDPEFLRRELPQTARIRRLQGWVIALGARRCAEVHYPTESMRRLVEEGYPALAPRGRANAFGINSRITAGGALVPRERAPGEPWTFLYVMNYTLQKNLGFLLGALAQARAAGLPVRVRITSRLADGPPATEAADRARIARDHLIESGYLELAGPQHGAALRQAYADADACVFPSICEAFGHPMLEALALGRPLICADRPFAREICGEHALYVDPERPEELVDLWRRWPEPAGSLPPLPSGELERRFSWEGHVSRLLEGLLR